MLRHIPNLLSISRLLVTPIVVWFISIHYYNFAFVLFFFASLTDAVDGIITRKFTLYTKLGSYIDPIADKILLIATYVALGLLGEIQNWLVITVVTRDIFIMGSFFISLIMGLTIQPNPLKIGKLCTALQMIYLLLILSHLAFDLTYFYNLPFFFAVVVAIITILSGCLYLLNWLKIVME